MVAGMKVLRCDFEDEREGEQVIDCCSYVSTSGNRERAILCFGERSYGRPGNGSSMGAQVGRSPPAYPLPARPVETQHLVLFAPLAEASGLRFGISLTS